VLLLKQRLPPAYLGVLCYSGLRNQRANHLASQAIFLQMLLWVGSTPRHEEGPLSFISGARTNQPFHPPLTQREGTWPGGKARIRVSPQRRVSSPGLLPLTTMPGQFIVRVVGAIGLAVFASTPAFASDVSAMSCSQIGGFARQVAEQKLKGVTLKDAVHRFRKSFGLPVCRHRPGAGKYRSRYLPDTDLLHRQPGRGRQRLPDRL
jgi:hypothetical protein